MFCCLIERQLQLHKFLYLLLYLELVCSLTNLFPIVDLNYIREICEETEQTDDIAEIHIILNNVTQCLQNIPHNLEQGGQDPTTVTFKPAETENDHGGGRHRLPIPMAMQEISSGDVIECKYSFVYLNCYKIATDLLDKCEPGRGIVLQTIHNTLHTTFCENNGITLKEAFEESAGSSVPSPSSIGPAPGCIPNYNEAESCISDSALDNWESNDLCTSYKALLKCQESALMTESCSKLNITKFIIHKLRQGEIQLQCTDFMRGDSNFGVDYESFIKNYVSSTLQFNELFPNPGEELDRILATCKSKNISLESIEQAKNESKRCVEPLLGKSETEIDPRNSNWNGTNNCEIVQQRNECWKPIEAKINECSQNVGGTNIGNIYRAMVAALCPNLQKLRSLMSSHNCPHNTSIPACKNIEFGLNCEDNCISFQQRKKCFEDSIAYCPNEKYKEYLSTEILPRAEVTLKCQSKHLSQRICNVNATSYPNKSSKLIVTTFLEQLPMIITIITFFLWFRF